MIIAFIDWWHHLMDLFPDLKLFAVNRLLLRREKKRVRNLRKRRLETMSKLIATMNSLVETLWYFLCHLLCFILGDNGCWLMTSLILSSSIASINYCHHCPLSKSVTQYWTYKRVPSNPPKLEYKSTNHPCKDVTQVQCHRKTIWMQRKPSIPTPSACCEPHSF